MSADTTAVISPIALVLLAGASLVASGLRWRKLLGLMRRTTRPERRLDHLGARLRAFLVYVVAQGRLLRWPFAGVLHAFIFWGFVVLLTAIAQGIVEALWQGFQFNRLPGSGAPLHRPVRGRSQGYRSPSPGHVHAGHVLPSDGLPGAGPAGA